MRVKVELYEDVVWFLRHRCNADERRLFYEQLEVTRSKPIDHSEAVFDPVLSRFMLRFFRFGTNKAIFEFDPGRDRIRVLACEKLRPHPRQPGPNA
jgi:hypothetical protein